MSEQGMPQEQQGQTPGNAPGNALVPAGVDHSQLPALTNAMGQAHSGLRSRYEKLREAESRISVARVVMDELAAMQDTVTQDDVVKGAGRLVAAGGGAAEVAGMLAEMPPDGEALQGWVAQKDAGLQRIEALLEEQMSAARYQMGVGALQHIAATQAHSEYGLPAPTAVPAAPAGNPLMAGVPAGGASNE